MTKNRPRPEKGRRRGQGRIARCAPGVLKCAEGQAGGDHQLGDPKRMLIDAGPMRTENSGRAEIAVGVVGSGWARPRTACTVLTEDRARPTTR